MRFVQFWVIAIVVTVCAFFLVPSVIDRGVPPVFSGPVGLLVLAILLIAGIVALAGGFSFVVVRILKKLGVRDD